MDLSQNDFDHIRDLKDQGKITLDEAHVMMVRARRVLLVTSRLPADVRTALNVAVKRGELGHFPKAHHRPEVFFHPTFDFLAKGERARYAENIAKAISGVCR